MNSDPNQPQDQPQQPDQVAQTPAPEAPVVPEQPVEGAQAETPASTPNPFGSAPVSSDAPASNPFGAAPDPAASAPSSTTIGSAPVGDPLSAPSPKSNKKLIVLISAIVGGLLVLGGIAFAIYFMFFAVTKADYQKAYDQVSLVRDKYKDAGSVSASSSEATIKETEADFEAFKTENAKLGGLKALKADKDLKAKYDAYNTKAVAYIALGNTLFPSLNRFVEASGEIKELGTGSSSFTSANIQKMIDILKGIDDITDPTLKTYLDSTIKVYEEILPQVKIYESKTATSTEKRAAITAMSDSLGDISDAATKLSKDLKAKGEETDLADTLNDLGKTVTSKLNDAK